MEKMARCTIFEGDVVTLLFALKNISISVMIKK